MSNKFIDVHTFDGKLKGIFHQTKIYSKEEKKESFMNLIQKLVKTSAIEAVHTIINDLSNEKGNNFQSENDLDASNILMEILTCIDNSDVIKMLEEQLVDTKNLGICNSGRVTRLLQIWIAFCKS